MPDREPNPSTAFWLSIGIAIAAGLAVVGWALRAKAKPLPRAKALPPNQAVKAAVDQLGVDAHPYALTDFAYALAYPECPTVPDEDDPEHDRCRGLWIEMSMLVRDTLGIDPDAEVEPPPASSGIAQGVLDFIASLNEYQRTEIRRIVGALRYDGLIAAAESGSDAAVQAQMMMLRKDAEKLMKDSPLQAAQMAFKLQSVLGDAKVEEFLELAK